MPEQLDLFPPRKCDHCKKGVGEDPKNPFLWNGFLDADTKEHVCRECRSDHYALKSKTKYKNLYSETPVPI